MEGKVVGCGVVLKKNKKTWAFEGKVARVSRLPLKFIKSVCSSELLVPDGHLVVTNCKRPSASEVGAPKFAKGILVNMDGQTVREIEFDEDGNADEDFFVFSSTMMLKKDLQEFNKKN
jgi:hypothetical protein